MLGALPGQAVVLAPPAGLRQAPHRLDEPPALEAVQERVNHAVRPLQLAARHLAHPLDDGVAVAIALAENGEHQRRCGSGDEILVDIHSDVRS